MKKRLIHPGWLGLALVIILCFSIQIKASTAPYNITHISVNLDVHSDNSYRISEVLSVTFNEPRHGLIRQIPRKTNKGANVRIEDIYVEGVKYAIEKDSNWLNLRMGDPDQTIIGPQTYIITYTYKIGDDRVPDYDELYFNIIGSDFSVPIDQVDFTITMPFPFDSDLLNFTTGTYGSVNTNGVDYRVAGQTIQGRTLMALGPNEALTVALPLPQGYYVDVPPPSRLPYLIILFPIVFLSIGFFIWIKKGRKVSPIPTVEFYPPADTTSADVGYLIDGQLSASDITSLIVYWADQGYLTIHESTHKKLFGQRKSFYFVKVQEPDAHMRDYERDFFIALFRCGNGQQVTTQQLENQFYRSVSTIKTAIIQSFELDPTTKIFSPSNRLIRGLLSFISFLTLLPFTLLAIYGLLYNFDSGTIFIAGLLTLIFIIFSHSLVATLATWKHQAKKGRLRNLLSISVFFIGLIIFYFYLALTNGFLVSFIITLISALIIIVLSFRCDRRTDLGQWYEERLLGFRDFIRATELDRIKLLVQENPHYFYNILPYAMALGVTKEWAKGFEHIAVEPPTWYYGAAGLGAFNAYAFANELDSNMHQITESLASSPSNSQYGSGGSDSGSGGSAGGGSGGGGASDW